MNKHAYQQEYSDFSKKKQQMINKKQKKMYNKNSPCRKETKQLTSGNGGALLINKEPSTE